MPESDRDDEPDVDDGADEPRRPIVDLSAAVHVAGHETELLHAEGITDSAPVLHDDHPSHDGFGLAAAAGYQLRGMDADLADVDEDPELPD